MAETDPTLQVRPAQPEDVPALLELFGELAEYEHLTHELRATEERLDAMRCSASARRPPRR